MKSGRRFSSVKKPSRRISPIFSTSSRSTTALRPPSLSWDNGEPQDPPTASDGENLSEERVRRLEHAQSRRFSPETSMTPQDQWLSQKERILAWFRLGFAITAVLVIQLNPSRVARFPLLSYISLGSFVIYSLALLHFALHKRTTSQKIQILATCLDLLWVSLIVFSTGG